MSVKHIQYLNDGLLHFQESRVMKSDRVHFLRRNEKVYGDKRLEDKGVFYQRTDIYSYDLNSLDRCISFLAALCFKLLGLVHADCRAWGREYWQQWTTGVKKITTFTPLPVSELLDFELQQFNENSPKSPLLREFLTLVEIEDKDTMERYCHYSNNTWSLAAFRHFANLYGDVAPPQSWIINPQHDAEWLKTLPLLKRLENLDIDLRRVGFNPDELVNIKNLPLKALTLKGRGRLLDSHLEFLKEMDTLEEFSISGYAGEGLKHLKGIKNLKVLSFRAPNHVTKEKLFEVVKELSIHTLVYSGALSEKDIAKLHQQNPKMVVITLADHLF